MNPRADKRQVDRLGAAVGALLVAAVVVIVVVPWHVVNRHVPEWDGAGFVLVAQKIAQSFDQGFLQGISALYFERMWRPIIFPSIAAPFFIMTSGNISASVTLTQCICALIAGLYVYLFLRDIVGWLRAAVGTSFVVSLAYFANYAHFHFWSEPFWLAATAGTLFHFFCGLRLEKPRHFVAAGVWFGLMVDIRPAETVVLATLPVCALLAWAYRSGRVSAGDILVLALQVIAAVGAVALKLLQTSDPWIYVLLLIATIIAVVRARRFFIESPVLGFLVIAEAVSIGWHLPSMQILYDWAYSASFGSWAQLSDQKFAGLSLIAIIRELLRSYSPTILVVLGVISVVALAGWRRPYFARQTVKPLITIAIAVLAVIPILILHFLSGTSDDRRIMPAMLLLYVGLVALTLLPKGFVPRIRLLTVAILAALQITSVVANALRIGSPAISRLESYTGPLRGPDISPDPAVMVLDGLLALGIRSGFVLAYSHCLMGIDSCQSSRMPLFEHVAISTIALERRLQIYVHYFNNVDFSKPEALSDQVRAFRAEYVLVDMFNESDFREIDHAHPYFRVTAAFITLARDGFPSGFTKVGCFDSLGRPMCVFEISR